MGRVDEVPRGTQGTGPAPSAWRALWPYLVLPPLIVAAGVAWLWFGAEGGFAEAGRYTLS